MTFPKRRSRKRNKLLPTPEFYPRNQTRSSPSPPNDLLGNNNDIQDDFEFNGASLAHNVLFPCSSSVMMQNYYGNGNRLPILLAEVPLSTSFLSAESKGDEDDEEKAQEDKDDEDEEDKIQIPDLDSTKSNLTLEQHTRYKQLLHDIYFSNRNRKVSVKQKREFHSLRSLVLAEREMYRQALIRFRKENMRRFLEIGFDAQTSNEKYQYTKEIVLYSSKKARSYYSHWLDKSNFTSSISNFGSSIQQISLELFALPHHSLDIMIPDDIPSHISRENGEHLKSQQPFGNIVAKILGDGNKHMRSVRNISNDFDRIFENDFLKSYKSTTENTRTNGFLRHDKTAIELVKKHDIDLVITDKSFIATCQRPGERTRWKLPLSVLSIGPSNKLTSIIEDLLPEPQNPRECITEGINHAAWQHFASKVNTKNIQDKHVDFKYILVVLQSSIRPKDKSIRVLVRCENKRYSAEGYPLRIFTHLEYFKERGDEIRSSSEVISWLVETTLQPNVLVKEISIDASSGLVLEEEVKNHAHILSEPTLDARKHFDCASAVFRGVSLLPEGEFLARFPGVDSSGILLPLSVSLHKANDEKKGNVTSLNIEREFSRAEEVHLNGQSLLDCFHMWNWNNVVSNVPFTFQVDETN